MYNIHTRNTKSYIPVPNINFISSILKLLFKKKLY